MEPPQGTQDWADKFKPPPPRPNTDKLAVLDDWPVPVAAAPPPEQPPPPAAPGGPTVFAVVKVGRQDSGEFVFVATEGVFTAKAKAEDHVRSLGQQAAWEKIMGIDCWCERGIHETPFHSD